MKDDFNFEEVLGRLAQCVANKSYFDIKEPLKELAAHPDNTEVLSTLSDTIDYLIENAGAQFMLYQIDELLDGLKNPKTIEASYLQAKLVEKWEAALDEGIRTQTFSTLSYLTGACRMMTPDDPLSPLALPRWEKLVDSLWPLPRMELKCTLSMDRDMRNADFRKLALAKLVSLKDADPDVVFKMLDEGIDRGGFYSFKDSDPDSAKLMIDTMAHILEKQKAGMPPKKLKELSWKVFSHGDGCDADGAEKAARIYLDLAAQEKNPHAAFNEYRGLVSRRNPRMGGVRRDASLKILDLVDAGKLKDYADGYHEVPRCVAGEIFEPAIAKETKDDALAERAAATMLSLVREGLGQPKTNDAYVHYNNAVSLIEYYDAADPRAAEVRKLWLDGLTRDFKPHNDDYYARQMGRMLDLASQKGDAAFAEFARQEWRDAIERSAKPFVTEAYRAVQQIVVNAAHYSPDSRLVAEARAMLPDLEKRAGVKRTPEKLGNDDFRKMIGKKKQPGFKP
ncbi:MAG: hypothetical protein EPN97_10105 [Alphaproteobacteria bacterium]|nr:MAG: hypothetical protein EPN97_10105 [Alphaproteobacteria bacterium]